MFLFDQQFALLSGYNNSDINNKISRKVKVCSTSSY